MTQHPHPEDEGRLRRYILGTLPEEESAEIERRYFSDGSFFEELLAEENEILDAYASGDLSGEERRRFESLMKSSSRLRKRAAFAETLLRLERRPGRRGLVAALLLAATVVLALGSMWIVRESRRRPVAGEVAVNRPEPALVAPVSTAPPAAATPSRAAASRTPGAGRPDPRLAVFVLAAGLTRNASDLTPVSIPGSAERVELDLPLEADEHPAYSVNLQSAAGADVLTRHGLHARGKNGGRLVAFEVPAGRLPSGDYLVTLSGERPPGPAEALGEYAFRVK